MIHGGIFPTALTLGLPSIMKVRAKYMSRRFFLIFLKIKGSQKKSVFFFLIILNFLQHDTDNVKFFCNMILIRMIREGRERIESDRMDAQLLTFIIHC